MARNIIGNEVASSANQTTQVYKLTHDGAGNRLPYMNRSFISFTFGGKAIEDFGLIVVNGGDRMERNTYAPFTDLTSTYDTLDGQLYWGSKFEPNQLELTLSTDEITDNQLNDFNEWFAPGKVRELILSEHPNRAIFARVATTPVVSVLPFEKKTSVIINEILYNTSTTVYRGEISLSFVMDEPHWFAKINYMPAYIDKETFEKVDVNSENVNKVETLTNKDMIKVMLEDGLPYQNMLNGTMFLGGNVLVTAESRVGYTIVGQSYLGIITSNSNGITIGNNNPGYLFYSGTAPSYPIIQFDLPVASCFDNNGYINIPKNKIQDPSLTQYSTISIGNNVFEFTTPSILTGYNKAIQLFTNNSNLNDTELLLLLKSEINEYRIRAWAIQCLNAGKNNFRTNMPKFFEPGTSWRFIFNSKTGEAIGRFSINIGTNNNPDYEPITENVGDMVRSKYLTIEGRNFLNANGTIIPAQNCKTISTNIGTLNNVLIFFKNMYL